MEFGQGLVLFTVLDCSINLSLQNVTINTFLIICCLKKDGFMGMCPSSRRAKSGVKMRHLIVPEIWPVAYLQEISLWNKFKSAQYFHFKLSQIVNIHKEILLIVREIS